jgi:hypothetical protein
MGVTAVELKSEAEVIADLQKAAQIQAMAQQQGAGGGALPGG